MHYKLVDGKCINYFEIIYPAEDKQRYDEAVTYMFNTFVTSEVDW